MDKGLTAMSEGAPKKKGKSRPPTILQLITLRQEETKWNNIVKLGGVADSRSTPRSQRVQIQFRLGARLLSKIDAAAEEERITRNEWLMRACVDKLARVGVPGVFNAAELTAERVPVLFRVHADLKRLIDRDYQGNDISTRTMWLVEAILGSLSQYKFS
jgi:hypothetical protein